MYTTDLKVSNYNDRKYKVEINAAWIVITDITTGKVVRRRADEGIWYDPEHQQVMKTLYQLEKDIFALFDKGE